MQLQVRNSLIAVLLLLTTSATFAASVSFVKKEPVASSTKSNYLYKYTCRNNVQGMLSVTGTTDNEANKLAQDKAVRVCEE